MCMSWKDETTRRTSRRRRMIPVRKYVAQRPRYTRTYDTATILDFLTFCSDF